MILSAPLNVNTNGDNTIVAARAGSQIAVVGFRLSFSGTVNAKWTDGPAGTLLDGLYYGGANIQVVCDPIPFWYGAAQQYQFKTTAGNALVLNLSAGTTVGGIVLYSFLPV